MARRHDLNVLLATMVLLYMRVIVYVRAHFDPRSVSHCIQHDDGTVLRNMTALVLSAIQYERIVGARHGTALMSMLGASLVALLVFPEHTGTVHYVAAASCFANICTFAGVMSHDDLDRCLTATISVLAVSLARASASTSHLFYVTEVAILVFFAAFYARRHARVSCLQ